MALYDYWLNPLTVGATQVIGYRGEIEEFQHDLYSFLLSTIREQDQNVTALIWRWLQIMQEFWESQYGQILAMPLLNSPEKCPEAYLDHLRKKIGIMDDISFVWTPLTTTEKRRLIKYFIRFLRYRSTSFGIDEIIETMTGQPSEIFGYFNYRWLLSGDDEDDLETASGREDDGYDPYLLSETNMPVGIIPDTVSTSTIDGYTLYTFTLDNLVNSTTNDTPEEVYIRFLGTGAAIHAPLIFNGTNWTATTEQDYVFLQTSSSISTEPSNFRASFETDEYVLDILMVDDGTLNRDMIIGLVRFSRPSSENIYIRYYNMIDLFSTFGMWDEIEGTATHSEDNKNVVLADVAEDTIIQANLDGSEDWFSYAVHVKMQHGVTAKYAIIRFMVQGINDYYYLKVTPSAAPTVPAAAWEIRKYVSGSDSLLISGTLDQMDIDVDYIWRIESFTSSRPGGDVQVIRLFQDENLLTTYVDDPASWGGGSGTVEIVCETGGSLTVSRVLVHPIPQEYDYVGP